METEKINTEKIDNDLEAINSFSPDEYESSIWPHIKNRLGFYQWFFSGAFVGIIFGAIYTFICWIFLICEIWMQKLALYSINSFIQTAFDYTISGISKHMLWNIATIPGVNIIALSGFSAVCIGVVAITILVFIFKFVGSAIFR